MISSTSTADYEREEVEASLSNIADAFHVIGQEYKKLVGVVPHMSKTQAASVIARMSILPLVRQEAKAESKQDPAEHCPSTTQEQIAILEEPRVTQDPAEVMEEETVEKEEDESEVEVTDKYFRKYILTGKGKDPKVKINKACKEINYQNLVVLIAVGDYVINKAKNIKEIAKKWGLSFRSIQWAMSRKKEHSKGGRQYTKRKKLGDEKEEPVKKSKHLKEKGATASTKVTEAEKEPTEETEPDRELIETSSGEELPDVPWTKS